MVRGRTGSQSFLTTAIKKKSFCGGHTETLEAITPDSKKKFIGTVGWVLWVDSHQARPA
jgi:hypothetical protein